jgi:hypothetical protein
LIASILVGILGPQWWLLPETSPFGPAGVGPAAAGAAIVSVTGVVTALAHGSRLGPAGRRMAVVAAVGQSLVLAFAGIDITARMVDDGADQVGLRLLHLLGAVAVGALWLAVASRDPRLTRELATEEARYGQGV